MHRLPSTLLTVNANTLLKQLQLHPHDIEQRDYAALLRSGRRQWSEKQTAQWRQRLQQSAQRVAQRTRNTPTLNYDPDLPITQHRQDLIEAIRQHPVVIVAGDTGSGKSTQLPKLCLEAGRGSRGLIGCTQPRRIAARSVAARVAEEMQVTVGGLVGFQVRFTDRSDEQTRIKFMTDGILLAEVPHDRWLDAYDTLIIDEAHERSLNIDFLLGYLKRVLSRRPDLRVIITSATIDTERFAKHFDQAPVIQVEGRTYPVEIRYREPPADGERGLYSGLIDAVDELNRLDPQSDILVFLSGEREIREAANRLRRRQYRHTEVQPLYARLSQQAQMAVFHPGPQRRIVLATNVAETSLTVPRIRFVIDTGLARISRYNHRSRIQRLPIEPISQASANQRAGRCGRLGPGVCIRLYAEDDFDSRPAFTEPEILRTSLASVILRLAAMGLGDIEAFPFIEPPPRAMVSDAFQLLQELQAMDGERQLTPLGRQLSRLPVDVRLGRMLVEGERLGCLRELLVLCAVLAIQDPRERPLEMAQAADQAHARFHDTKSDFAGLLKLWHWLIEQRSELGSSAYRKELERGFLSWQRVREWQDLRRQLAEICRDAGMNVNTQAGDGEAIHLALLSGLLSHIGQRDDERGDYQGARGRRFHIFPGSALFKSKSPWLMCAEIVETGRVYGRTVAAINSRWLERQGEHLLRWRYFDPYWEPRSGRVMGYAQITLYGLTIAERRRLHYGPHDTSGAHRLFILHALVRGEMQQPPPFISANRQQVQALQQEEHKRRRHDLLVREDRLVAFFAERIPAELHTVKDFLAWYRQQPPASQQRLLYTRELLLQTGRGLADAEAYPDTITIQQQRFPLRYHFEPEADTDGVTVSIPLHALNTLSEAQLSWLVPGLLEEKIIALINTLPKPLRRALTPAGEYATAVLESVDLASGHLLDRLSHEIERITGLKVNRESWKDDKLPAHLKMRIQVIDPQGRELAAGRDLAQLQQQLGQRARSAFLHQQGGDWQRDGLTDWSFGALPDQVITSSGAKAWPAVVDQGAAVGVRLFETLGKAQQQHRAGIIRLLQQPLNSELRYIEKNSGLGKTAGLHYAPLGSITELRQQLSQWLLQQVARDTWQVRDADAFNRYQQQVRKALTPLGISVGKTLAQVLSDYHQIQCQLRERDHHWNESLDDVQSQIDDLVYSGFLADISQSRLEHYPRYLQGILWRLEKLRSAPGKDLPRLRQIQPWWQRYLDYIETHAYNEALDEYRWLVEEFRISLFAQQLKTAQPVSEKRLQQAWRAVTKD
ncbi:MAG: ATP-dependent RNA helicase HrpA [Wenzhouxiangellaceae bacterium]